MSGYAARPRRRRFPFWLLVAAFIGIPILEIYVIIQVGQVIGAAWTIVLLIADSIFGSWLIRREGRRAWLALNTALESGRMPAAELADGALILVGGTLMLSQVPCAKAMKVSTRSKSSFTASPPFRRRDSVSSTPLKASGSGSR